ncbi:MAG: thymidine kinase [Armatimonadetes bacterium RBG_16_67_12]|nr:MAG: thymidine kinase [Armatimonadetes bacterium RBG_16_67_12]
MDRSGGSIEVVCGSMFSGKTEELIRRVRRAHIAKQRVQVFKHALDDRYAVGTITSHNGAKTEAVPVSDSEEILRLIEPATEVVAVDEAQFLDDGIAGVASALARRGMRVILAGLDTNFRGDPFGPMPLLLALAEDVTKLQAICVVCGAPASRTQRLVDGRPAHYADPVVLIGAQEAYEARCRRCHQVPGRPGV